MDILLDNILWMLWNVFLAALGVIFGFCFLNTKNPKLKKLFFILWVLFVPNTIYLVTDIQYFPGQFLKLGFSEQILLISQYFTIFLLGVITFFFGLYPLEKILKKLKDKNLRISLIFLGNYLIAFAVLLGKIQRVSSWYVVTDPQKTILGIQNTLTSPPIMLAILIFGSVTNLIYFAFRKKIFKKIFKKLF